MQRVFCICVLLLSCVVAAKPSTLSGLSESESIRVRLFKSTKSIEVSGLALEYGSATERKLLSRTPGSVKTKIEFSNGVFFLKQNGQHSEILHRGPLYLSAQNFQINGDPLDGELKLLPRKGQFFQVILELPIDEYLIGVLPSEMPASWPLEALKAQAVASRSYALALKRERAHLDFDLEVTIEDQVYNTRHFRDAGLALQEKVRQAVGATRGEVLTKGGSGIKAFKAFFHAHCGGKTSTSQAVWGVGQQKTTVEDSFCQMDRSGQWTADLSVALLKKQFFPEVAGRESNIEGVGEGVIEGVGEGVIEGAGESVGEGTFDLRSSDFTQKVMLTWGPLKKVIPVDQFRKTLGYTTVKSAKFSVERFGEQLKLTGKGNGHGVGMCQTGAKFMALTGATYDKILSRYYDRAVSTAVAKADITPEQMGSQIQ